MHANPVASGVRAVQSGGPIGEPRSRHEVNEFHAKASGSDSAKDNRATQSSQQCANNLETESAYIFTRMNECGGAVRHSKCVVRDPGRHVIQFNIFVIVDDV